jgi:hypothetical protein
VHTLTTLQAFAAMCRILQDHAHGSHTLGDLLDELGWDRVWEDGEPNTALPGIWYEWQQAVVAVLADEATASDN